MLALRIFWAAALPHLKFFAKIGGGIFGMTVGIGGLVSLIALIAFAFSIGVYRFASTLFQWLMPTSVDTPYFLGFLVAAASFVGCIAGVWIAVEMAMEGTDNSRPNRSRRW